MRVFNHGLCVWMQLRFEVKKNESIADVRPEMVDFGSGQGRSEFETAGVAVTPLA